MTRFHASVKLVSIPFNEDRISIENLHLLHCVKIVKRISKEAF